MGSDYLCKSCPPIWISLQTSRTINTLTLGRWVLYLLMRHCAMWSLHLIPGLHGLSYLRTLLGLHAILGLHISVPRHAHDFCLVSETLVVSEIQRKLPVLLPFGRTNRCVNGCVYVRCVYAFRRGCSSGFLAPGYSPSAKVLLALRRYLPVASPVMTLVRAYEAKCDCRLGILWAVRLQIAKQVCE